jgi:A/G-specific adenine glycosylase
LRETIETPQRMSDTLLEWYDANARAMPWRVAPQARQAGVYPDPYRIWLSEVMLQQTTVAAVRSYFAKFTTLWPDVRALAAAQDADVMAAWAGLGYYARARNLLKCARVVAHDLGGEFPRSNAALLKLPGIGPYTAAAVGAIAFDLPETVVDGNVERVMARLHGVQTPLPIAKPELTALAAGLTPTQRPGDYAQAVMDLGATICTPRNPACGLCPWRTPCVARRAGDAAQLPRKVPKTPKPVRLGAIYVGRRADGAWLLETRPEKGLLGGMLGWPTTHWAENSLEAKPPLDATWREAPTEVRHTFTHFHLRLRVFVAILPLEASPRGGVFVDSSVFEATNLPTVMRKAYDAAVPVLS